MAFVGVFAGGSRLVGVFAGFVRFLVAVRHTRERAVGEVGVVQFVHPRFPGRRADERGEAQREARAHGGEGDLFAVGRDVEVEDRRRVGEAGAFAARERRSPG